MKGWTTARYRSTDRARVEKIEPTWSQIWGWPVSWPPWQAPRFPLRLPNVAENYSCCDLCKRQEDFTIPSSKHCTVGNSSQRKNIEIQGRISTSTWATGKMYGRMRSTMIYILWCSVCLSVTKNEHFLYRSANNEMKYKYVSINT